MVVGKLDAVLLLNTLELDLAQPRRYLAAVRNGEKARCFDPQLHPIRLHHVGTVLIPSYELEQLSKITWLQPEPA
ncbi:hypothetical protein [Streptomyces chartreusis]|uniref:hypothetical protein n=1 Tax=Streptomyces chartreusis TaxID=1969 RepID=UPI002E80D7D2|nr:hypothetical protein [Streptomyces chartreusis]WUB18344.1 hypothetical protein OG997_17160 [Streptomyces chartreusis]